ncbi:hypothetical protein [Ketogulonicigenium vulgare]|uniref:hypothetical protein n=1 Tax=Ketogulonicigenium vulgare TaxID=92945 RepID=UPI000A4795F7
MIRLGLIGDNIKQSQSPALHRLAGALAGLDVSYDLLIPAAQNRDFDALFAWAHDNGYHGLNITYPYKERVTPMLQIPQPAVAALGACNTVIFGDTPWDIIPTIRALPPPFASDLGGETGRGRDGWCGRGGQGRGLCIGGSGGGAACDL